MQATQQIRCHQFLTKNYFKSTQNNMEEVYKNKSTGNVIIQKCTIQKQ